MVKFHCLLTPTLHCTALHDHWITIVRTMMVVMTIKRVYMYLFTPSVDFGICSSSSSSSSTSVINWAIHRSGWFLRAFLFWWKKHSNIFPISIYPVRITTRLEKSLWESQKMSQPTITTTQVRRSGDQFTTETTTATILEKVRLEPVNYRDPGWSTCPYCGDGHDPCEACFDWPP